MYNEQKHLHKLVLGSVVPPDFFFFLVKLESDRDRDLKIPLGIDILYLQMCTEFFFGGGTKREGV